MLLRLLPILGLGSGLVILLGSLLTLNDPSAGLLQALVGGILGIVLLSVSVRLAAPDSPDVIRLIIVAALIRMAAAVMFHNFGVVEATFAPDAPGYDAGGLALAESWHGMGSAAYVYERRGLLYYWLVGVQYFFGHAPLLPKVTNAVLGAATVFYVWRIASLLQGEKAGWWAAGFVAFFPSLILWSSLNIRDSLAILLVCVVAWHAISLKQQGSVGSIVMLSLGLMGVGLVRDYLFLILAFAVLIGLFLTSSAGSPRNVVAFLLIAGLIFAVHQTTRLGTRFVEDVSLSEMQRLRVGASAGAGSAYLEDHDISTPLGLALFLPLGLAYFLASPFPWQIGGLKHLLPLPEMLVWYCLIPFVYWGMRGLIRRNYNLGIVPVAIALGLIVSYGLGSTNIGTAYRHRGQVMPILLTFAAIGILVRQEEKLQPAARARSPQLVWGPDGRAQWVER